MPKLHLTRVAYGCSDVAMLAGGIAARSHAGEVYFTTRNRPRRADDLVGGYLHFIIRHTLVARVRILRFDDADDGRTNINCSDQLELVEPTPRRAHQGWRYLDDSDAPMLLGSNSGGEALPLDLARELGKLALI